MPLTSHARDSITVVSVDISQVEVYDNKDGTYSLVYNLAIEGQWVLHPTVNRAAVRQHNLTVWAEQAPLQARDISFTLQQLTGGVAACGDHCRVQIQVQAHPVSFVEAC